MFKNWKVEDYFISTRGILLISYDCEHCFVPFEKRFFKFFLQSHDAGSLICPSLYIEEDENYLHNWYFSDVVPNNSIQIVCNNDYSYINCKFQKDQIFVFKFFQYFRRHNFHFGVLIYLMNTKFNYIWEFMSLVNNDPIMYYKFLIMVTLAYNNLWDYFNNSSKNPLLRPDCSLNTFSNYMSSSCILSEKYPIEKVQQLQVRSHIKFENTKSLISFIHYLPSLQENISFYEDDDFYVEKLNVALNEIRKTDYNLNFFTIHFLRVQRRYNKRRYSKVRLYSRPSFFGGVCLGSLFISCFWGGTMKSVDWYVTNIICVNMNVVLLFSVVLVFIRLLIVDFNISSLHNYSQITIYTALQSIMGNSFIRKIFKLKK